MPGCTTFTSYDLVSSLPRNSAAPPKDASTHGAER
jgi:hypothetical protein